MKKPEINKLIRISKNVIEDCSLENGAIVAADSGKSAYPSAVQDYRYVWVRDASYICIAADLLGLKDIPEKFFDWCLYRAEGFRETGLFSNAYNINGTIHGTLVAPADLKIPRKVGDIYGHLIHHGTQFQPDQNGSLLVAIGHHIKRFGTRNITRYKKIIQHAASGICSSWKDRRFILPCFDLWEERCLPPKQKRIHTYSLAMCIAGLRIAISLSGKKKDWLRTEKEMSEVFATLYASGKNSIPGTYGGKFKKEDFLPDTSLLGLVYPAAILEASDPKMETTVDEIIKQNTTANGGLMRYPNDKYCGGVKNGRVTLTGAGAWPLLNFWMAIYFSMRGDKKKAEKYFNWPLGKIDKYIPEQIFEVKKKLSVSPLAWSHAMFIIAANFLGNLSRPSPLVSRVPSHERRVTSNVFISGSSTKTINRIERSFLT
ncbi:MAG: glycoside hydrolase family 15 protein [Sedimentisphaerales bacterium]|nr:glycoside hydrolase family 15 protein [Sedimentisphaerales bacterium]